MSEQNIQVIKQAYEHFQTGNIESLLGQLSNDVHWQTPKVKNMPYGGTYQGNVAVSDFFGGLAASEDVQKFEPTEFLAQGERVVVLGRYGARVKATGRDFEFEFVHVFSVSDGKITSFTEYFDTAVAEAAYLKSQSA